MDVWSVVDIVAFHAQITSFVTSNDEASDIPPFSRRIETLVDVSVEAEGYIANLASKGQISKPVLQRI